MFRTSIAALFLLGVPVASVTAQSVIVSPPGGIESRGKPSGEFTLPGYQARGFPSFSVWSNTGRGYYYAAGYYYSGDYYTAGGFYYPDWYNYGPYGGPYGDVAPAPYYPEEPRVELSNEFPATLTVQLPAPGNVWANGIESEGSPTTEWTLSSPVLKMGQEFKFDVKARWKVDGKTFEYNRTIPVDIGNRSKVLVLVGDEVR